MGRRFWTVLRHRMRIRNNISLGRTGVAGMKGQGVVKLKRIGILASAVAVLALVSACGEKEVILQGKREDVRDALAGTEPRQGGSAVAQSAPISLPAAVSNAEWAQRGGNARHAAPHAALSAAPRLIFAQGIGNGSSRRNRIAVAPVVAGGKVYTMDTTAVVSAVSTSGALLWQADVSSPSDSSQVSGGGLAAEGGLVFATTGYGEVIALQASSGKVVWRQKVDAPVQGAPAVANGVVYASGRDGAAWAIEAATGKVVWQVVGTPGKTGYLGAAAPTVADRSVIFPSGAGDLMSVLKIGAGTKTWQESIAGRRAGISYGDAQDVTGDAALIGGTLFTGTAAGRTVAVDADSGRTLWSTDEGALGPLAIAGGSAFLLSDQARLVRLNASTGEVIWAVDLPYFVAEKVKKHKAITAHYGPVLAGGRLWVASSDGLLRGFSPIDGKLTYSVEIPGGAATQPAVAGGTLYVVSNNGQLLAFR